VTVSVEQHPVAGRADGVSLLVRYLPGVVGLTRRVVHVVPLTPGQGAPAVLVAHCGERIGRGIAEPVDPGVGSPCNACLLLAPTASTSHK
jgi:hypothetical protein